MTTFMLFRREVMSFLWWLQISSKSLPTLHWWS